MRYALILVIFLIVLCGAFYSGVSVGESNARVEYVTKEVEVIKYVDKKKALIYSASNASRDDLLKLLHNSKL